MRRATPTLWPRLGSARPTCRPCSCSRRARRAGLAPSARSTPRRSAPLATAWRRAGARPRASMRCRRCKRSIARRWRGVRTQWRRTMPSATRSWRRSSRRSGGSERRGRRRRPPRRRPLRRAAGRTRGAWPRTRCLSYSGWRRRWSSAGWRTCSARRATRSSSRPSRSGASSRRSSQRSQRRRRRPRPRRRRRPRRARERVWRCCPPHRSADPQVVEPWSPGAGGSRRQPFSCL
mmetsp:Transcript_22958/g.73595  ORF Transcript_22958/g.73595 Transcript_22958/m.73595 type:complete len:234 (+) Transcript_22958:973-1674(+)